MRPVQAETTSILLNAGSIAPQAVTVSSLPNANGQCHVCNRIGGIQRRTLISTRSPMRVPRDSGKQPAASLTMTPAFIPDL